jgi:putative membrane protein
MGALALGSFTASAQQPDPAKFLTDAMRTDVAEIKLGDLAQQRGHGKEVRDFGQTLNRDHTKSLQKASELAKSQGVAVPTEATAQAQKQYEALSKLSGEEFDSTFASQMARGHQEAIAKFSAQAQAGGGSDVAKFAKDTLPTLREHLEHAQSIQADLTSDARSSGKSGSAPAN